MMRDERGFTVPELLVTIVLLAIVLTAFGQVLITSSKTSNRVQEQAALQNDVRAVIDRLTSDFRQATTTNQTFSPVSAASATTLTFDTPDRGTPYHLRRISYRLVGGTLERSATVSTDTDGWPWVWPGTTGPWVAQLTSIANPSPFVFYDGNGAVTTNPTAVHSVRVTFTVAPKQTQGGANTYSALVTIRTLS
jgi:prepilin-type N-terminal cleavage/methylation domain-containing protein